MKKYNFLLINLFIVAALLFTTCKKKQYNLLPEPMLIAMAEENYRQILDSSIIISSGSDYMQIQKVGKNIASVVEKYLKQHGKEKDISLFNWEINLIQSDNVNAWCMPGGKIAFYTGILPYTQTEAGVAVVMGHEVAHAVARHGNARMSQELLKSAGGMLLSIFIANKKEETQAIFMTVFNVGTELGYILPYSREHELEADYLGLIFMAMAGYNPQEAIDFWDRMSQNSSNTPQILSTHPSDKTRIEELKKHLPEALEIYNGGS